MVSFAASTTIQVTGRALITRAVRSNHRKINTNIASSRVNGERTFHTGSNKMNFYAVCVST